MTNPQERMECSQVTINKIVRWIKAKKMVAQATSFLEVEKVELVDATKDLGQFLTPTDTKISESFNIWYGTGILQITKVTDTEYSISWRKEPSVKQRNEQGM